MKTATEILFEHSIDIMSMDDTFNSQLLTAMERYAEEKAKGKIPKLIVENLGNYVNGLDRRNLGVPLMDEVAVMQMEYIVSQVILNPSKPVEMPEYD